MLDVATGGQGTVQAVAVTWVTSQELCTVTEYPQLEGIHQDHRVQLLILHRTTQSIPPSGTPFDFATFLWGHIAKVILQI